MDEMDEYKQCVYRTYRRRRKKPREYSKGRRMRDYVPPFWNVGIVMQLLGLILTGLVAVMWSGCMQRKLF